MPRAPKVEASIGEVLIPSIEEVTKTTIKQVVVWNAITKEAEIVNASEIQAHHKPL